MPPEPHNPRRALSPPVWREAISTTYSITLYQDPDMPGRTPRVRAYANQNDY
jgi:hypothetical protein